MVSAPGCGSSSQERISTDRLMDDVRRGSTHGLGHLLDSYRNYLQLLAKTQIDSRFRAKISPSDLVQETLFHAYRDFGQFRGNGERQLLGWLRQILINRLHVFVQRHVLADKRCIRREVPLEEIGAALARSTANLEAGLFLADRGPSPSSNVIRRENAVLLADHLAEMAPHYRDVIVLRNLQGLSFDEVARRLNRTSGATRMMWLRAVRQLRQRMDGDSPDER